MAHYTSSMLPFLSFFEQGRSLHLIGGFDLLSPLSQNQGKLFLVSVEDSFCWKRQLMPPRKSGVDEKRHTSNAHPPVYTEKARN